ncbi:myosin light chain kinase 2, skeletal/cardiac muscle [Colius striatus]|nr:myosin light chain kinase 2, skeletal/cardiac muscle [Colius striatus]
MEQDGGVSSVPGTGGAADVSPLGAESGTAPAALQDQPQAGTVPAVTEAQDAGKDEPGHKKVPAAAVAQEPLEGEKEKAAPAEEAAAAAQHNTGQAAPAEKVPAGAKAQDRGKGKRDAPAAGEPAGGQAVPAEGKAPAAAKAQDGGKEQSSGGLEAESGGKAEPVEKAPVTTENEGGKGKPTEGTASAAAQAQDGGKEEPLKEKTPTAAKEKASSSAKAQDGEKKAAKTEKAPADKKPAKEKTPATKKEEAPATEKAQDGEKKAAKAEKTPATEKAQDGEKKAAKAEKAPAAKKPQEGGKEEPAKKAPAAGKPQDGENKVAKAEKAPAAKKAQDGSKEQPAKEKAAGPVKEKVPAAAKAQEGEKTAAKAEKAPAAKKPQDGGKKEPAKEKAPAAGKAQDEAVPVEPSAAAAEAGDGAEEPTETAATAVAGARGEGEETDKQQQPRGPEPPRPALLQSLSCPAACQREEQPWAQGAAMEMIPEEATAEPSLRDLEPPSPAASPGTPQERTVPSATGQPPAPAGATEQPGSGGPPSSTEAEPPLSPYLTPDFGKEDPFEILDDVPPPPAPFAHRIVTLRSASVSSHFNLSSKDILGGGKFGEVHTCTEKQTGLKLAAKVIRKQGAKDKEMVLLEIDVMNQLNHRNLIQLYDAIETPREIVLFMEFVEGGELFERIIDDDYHLTEVDCMVFVRQICEGIRFMHHMNVLHLDLKPENILCVAATGHMVKIIDFGLARRYNPQEKLKVNFGTPEFLSPEVVNYEQVSYSTDMWSMGVITYMLLSGLSPFLGDNDTETLNNVLAANWYFDEETFESVSDEAKDFVSNLIIKEKSARMSAGQCLKHPWLNNLAEKAKRCNRRLKSQVLLKKYVMRRRWKKNFIGVCAANRFKKITSSGSLTALGV